MLKLQSHNRKGEIEVCQKAEPLVQLLERPEKCPSKNKCFHPECAETHYKSLHDFL